MIHTLLLFKCKLLCYHANLILVSSTTRSPSASLQRKGFATKYTTVKWPIECPKTKKKGNKTTNHNKGKYHEQSMRLKVAQTG